MNKITISLTVNGKEICEAVEPRLLLSDFIRDHLDLTGTNIGCEHGVCGACTIMMNGKTGRSCLMFAVQADGWNIETVESLAHEDGTMNKIQEAMSKSHGLQCGFCTPGMLMTIEGFLKDNPKPSEEEIRKAISGNLCRCTGYSNIIEAVKMVTEEV